MSFRNANDITTEVEDVAIRIVDGVACDDDGSTTGSVDDPQANGDRRDREAMMYIFLMNRRLLMLTADIAASLRGEGRKPHCKMCRERPRGAEIGMGMP